MMLTYHISHEKFYQLLSMFLGVLGLRTMVASIYIPVIMHSLYHVNSRLHDAPGWFLFSSYLHVSVCVNILCMLYMYSCMIQ